MSLNTVLLIIGVIFVAVVVVAILRPHRRVKTRVKMLGAEFELESEEGADAGPSGAAAVAATPAVTPPAPAMATGVVAEGIHSGGRVDVRDGTGRGIEARQVDAAGDVRLEAAGTSPAAAPADDVPDAPKKA